MKLIAPRRYSHYTEVDLSSWVWPSFSFRGDPRLYCPCCGEYYHDPNSLDMLQAARDIVGRPFHLTSGHRCNIHNARVGGRPLSMHKMLALDISLRGHNLLELRTGLVHAGFTTFGYYGSFIHTDKRVGRTWYSKSGRKRWADILV